MPRWKYRDVGFTIYFFLFTKMKIKGVVMLDLLFLVQNLPNVSGTRFFFKYFFLFTKMKIKRYRDVGFTIFGWKFTQRHRSKIVLFLQVLLSLMPRWKQKRTRFSALLPLSYIIIFYLLRWLKGETLSAVKASEVHHAWQEKPMRTPVQLHEAKGRRCGRRLCTRFRILDRTGPPK